MSERLDEIIFAANESPTTSKTQIVTLTNDIGNKCKKEYATDYFDPTP